MSTAIEEVDAETRRKVAALIARGLPVETVARALLLETAVVEQVMQTPEYREKHAEISLEVAEEAGDLNDGWNAVEKRGLEITLEAMRFSRDPRFALMAALSANRARRRGSEERILDATRAGEGSGNLIVLQINKNYIGRAQEGALTIDVAPKREQPLEVNVSDVPNPKHVEKLLNIAPAVPVIGMGSFDKEILSQNDVDEFAEMLGSIDKNG